MKQPLVDLRAVVNALLTANRLCRDALGDVRACPERSRRGGIPLRGQALPTCFRAEGNQKQSESERNGSDCHRSSEGSKMPDAGSDQEGNPSSAKTRERCRKGESAGTAFRRILFGKPERVNRKVGAAQAQKE